MNASAATLHVRPEMFGVTERLAAPTVLVDNGLVAAPEEVGFNFPEFYDMARSSDLTDEHIADYTIHYMSGKVFKHTSPLLGKYTRRNRTARISVPNCMAQLTLLQSLDPAELAAANVYDRLDFAGIIRGVTIHETGHYRDHRVGHLNRTHALYNGGIWGSLAVGVSTLANIANTGPYQEASTTTALTSLAVLAATVVSFARLNPIEGPAEEFHRQHKYAQIVQFAPRTDLLSSVTIRQ